jgi:biotin carboxylase
MTSRILFVYARGGPPLEHALPRIAACGELHVLALKQLPVAAEAVWRPVCASIEEAWQTPRTGHQLVELIVEHATRISADAVLTLSEFAVVAVARSCQRLGLRGAGEGVLRARDKRLMRLTWERAGVPIPRFRPVSNRAELQAAVQELTPPVLLKAAWSAGSIGQIIVNRPEDVPAAWQEATTAMAAARELGFSELHEHEAGIADFLAEEIVRGSTESWYEAPGYGDYLSVEGIVARGKYHPVCITARIPTIAPFTELSNNAPCVLAEPLQRRIEATARAAVDALGLDTCGTHTEIKLAANNQLFVIESAARFGGVMVTREVEVVFGLDLIQMLVRELLGEHVEYPHEMLVSGRGAAASLAVISTRSDGSPWTRLPIFDSQKVDWPALVSPPTTVEVVKGLTITDGTRMPGYDRSGGARNWAGILFLHTADPNILLRDCYSILDNLEHALP